MISEDKVKLWNQRLGHMSSHTLNKLFSINEKSLKGSLNKCNVRPCAKQIGVSFPISNIKSNECFNLIHLDVWVLTILLHLIEPYISHSSE